MRPRHSCPAKAHRLPWQFTSRLDGFRVWCLTCRHFKQMSGHVKNNPFRILVVDDDSAAQYLLQRFMRDLPHPPDLFFVKNGVEALDFLHRRGAYQEAPCPNLILLDLNMPRLGGLETLAAIKSDPALRVVPVIMLSSSDEPGDIQKSYEAHANGYVQKPANAAQTGTFVQSLASFWVEFALLPVCERASGQAIAYSRWEEKSPAIKIGEITKVPRTRTSNCSEHNRLLDAFGQTVQELLRLLEQQFRAIVEGDSECNRFDLLIHMANEEKQMAKYAYLRHVESCGCSNIDAFDKTRT